MCFDICPLQLYYSRIIKLNKLVGICNAAKVEQFMDVLTSRAHKIHKELSFCINLLRINKGAKQYQGIAAFSTNKRSVSFSLEDSAYFRDYDPPYLQPLDAGICCLVGNVVNNR